MTVFQPVCSADQIAEVVRLAREIWPEHYTPIIGREQVDFMLEKFQSPSALAEQLEQGYEYILIVHDDRNAGYVAVVPDPRPSTLMLSKIYVRKCLRGQGLGALALLHVEDLCRQRGAKKLCLTVNRFNTTSIDFYVRQGFRNTGSVVQSIGNGFVMDDFRFEKPVMD